MPLRFNQFRSLLLTRPCKPTVHTQGADPHANVLEHRASTEYRVSLKSGGQLEGKTIGHVELDFGLFLFPPVDEEGTVTRLFVPRDAYSAYDMGPRIGEVLVASHALSEAQIEQAVEVQQ